MNVSRVTQSNSVLVTYAYNTILRWLMGRRLPSNILSECRAGIPEREFISNGLLPKVTLWYFSVINNGHKTLIMHGSTFFDSTIMEKSSSIGMFCKSSQRNQLTQIPCFSFGSRSPLVISSSYDTAEFGGSRLLY